MLGSKLLDALEHSAIRRDMSAGKRSVSGGSNVRLDISLAPRGVRPTATRFGYVSAYWMGSRMLGTPSCATTEPSTNSTIECTIDCG